MLAAAGPGPGDNRPLPLPSSPLLSAPPPAPLPRPDAQSPTQRVDGTQRQAAVQPAAACVYRPIGLPINPNARLIPAGLRPLHGRANQLFADRAIEACAERHCVSINSNCDRQGVNPKSQSHKLQFRFAPNERPVTRRSRRACSVAYISQARDYERAVVPKGLCILQWSLVGARGWGGRRRRGQRWADARVAMQRSTERIGPAAAAWQSGS